MILIIYQQNIPHFLGKHYSGHEHRAIFVTGIHSSCSLQILKHAIQLVLSDPFFNGPNNSILTPERVVLSQPMWTKSVPSRFERKAWIIMPTMSSVKLVLDRFSEIDIPSKLCTLLSFPTFA